MMASFDFAPLALRYAQDERLCYMIASFDFRYACLSLSKGSGRTVV